MLNSKLEVVNKHLEDGLLAGRLVVLLGTWMILVIEGMSPKSTNLA